MTIKGCGIRLAALSKRFGGQLALDTVDATVAPGSFTAILGPSGSGKSTLLMTIAGFERPDSGQVFLDGTDITGLAPEKRGIGVVFQGYALFPHMSVAANIAYPLRARGLGRKTVDSKVREMARMMEIEQLLERRPSEISGGQRQRVAIARALVFDPRLLLLDEPLSALDRNLRDRMKEELRRVHHSLGVTIVMVTHDQDEATELADRIVVMENGAVVGEGSPRGLYHRPPNARVAAFFGRANLLAVTGAAAGSVFAGGAAIERSKIEGAGEMLLIRPESLERVASPEGGSCLSLSIETLAFRSGRVSLVSRLPTGESLIVELLEDGGDTPAVGETIFLEVKRGYLLA